jgi:hypothetical protein
MKRSWFFVMLAPVFGRANSQTGGEALGLARGLPTLHTVRAAHAGPGVWLRPRPESGIRIGRSIPVEPQHEKEQSGAAIQLTLWCAELFSRQHGRR